MIRKIFRGIGNAVRFLFQILRPPPAWQGAVLVLCGVFLGLLIFTVHISRAASYLSDDPQTCINCHVMIPQYAAWKRSSHANTATCVDCHVPQDNVVRKYLFKASDGMRHTTMFALRWEPQVIRIKPAGAAVVQENCIRCHEHTLDKVSLHHVTYLDAQAGQGKLCWDCHREVPHGRTRSLSAAPYANVPGLDPVTPMWLEPYLPKIENYLRWNGEETHEENG